MNKKDALIKLYKEIHECHICKNMDGEKALRKIEAVNLNSDVFIISQALAKNQLRKSGINFFNEKGELGNTGRNLEAFLNKFGRTVYPRTDIILDNNITIEKDNNNLVTVYNTEIAQCYPGQIGNKDRIPRKKEIENCLKKEFLKEEINIIKPKLLLLMGKQSRDCFFKYVLEKKDFDSLTNHIVIITDRNIIPYEQVYNEEYYVMPIMHASGSNPCFQLMSKNEKLINLIKEVLN